MPLSEIIRLSFESLRANKFRSLLTMLGMIIGVLAVVLLVSIGEGAKNYILDEFEGLGTNLIVVQPGKSDKRSAFGHPMGVAERKLTLDDVRAVERSALNLEGVTGVVIGTSSVKYEESTSDSSIFGCNDQMFRIFNFRVSQGNPFSREDHDAVRRVAVIGGKVSEDLFGNQNPIGHSIRVNQSEFRVIGILERTGDKFGFNFDQFVFIPTTAALRIFNDDKLFGIRAKARSKNSMDDAVEEIRTVLRERHNDQEDFTIVTQLAMMQSMDTILNMLTYVLSGIAFISMVVAGIGIMNIMLVNVTERTHEIGIRRAVGARRRDILKQFLAEAMTLSFIGGSLGLGGAILITNSIHLFMPSFDMRAPLWIMPPAFMLSLVVGIVFGVWPARKASRIETLEALRYEG